MTRSVDGRAVVTSVGSQFRTRDVARARQMFEDSFDRRVPGLNVGLDLDCLVEQRPRRCRYPTARTVRRRGLDVLTNHDDRQERERQERLRGHATTTVLSPVFNAVGDEISANSVNK